MLVEYRGQIFADKYYFISSMPTEKGVSGAPLIMKDDQNLLIIGLHARKITEFLEKKAEIKLRREMLEEIRNNFKQIVHCYDYGKFGIT
jgi:hypothetical protein